jgi:dUTP pyrophosphatase
MPGVGVIDVNCLGRVKTILFNHSEVDFGVMEGSQVAQLVIMRISTSGAVVVEELAESIGGAGGLGNTG